MTLALRFNPFTGSLDYVDISAATGQAVPTSIADSTTFTVAAGTQIETAVPIVMGYGAVVELALGAVLATVGQL